MPKLEVNSFSIEGLRGFREKTTLELKPLTILVGANSAGKSTLARLFPLLKQSIEAETAGSILWNGRFVDFGSFNESLPRGAVKPSMKFGMNCTLAHDELDERYHIPSTHFIPKKGKKFNFDASFTLEKSSQDDGYLSYRNESQVEMDGNTIVVKNDEAEKVSGISLNGKEIENFQKMEIQGGKFFPHLELVRHKGDQFTGIYFSRKSNPTTIRPIANDLICNLLAPCYHKNTALRKLDEIASSLRPEEKADLIARLKASTVTYSNDKVSNDLYYKKIYDLVVANCAPSLMDYARLALEHLAGSANYMGPIRATAKRYYRRQELSVDEVDHMGENIPMIINGLSRAEIASLSEFCSEFFGFSVDKTVSSGHISILIKDSVSGGPINISDLGFGYSQILPVVVQAWAAKAKPSMNGVIRPAKRMIIIEQPELHLHPALQAKLADMFVSMTSSGLPINVLIETHSEALLNRLGHLISTGKYDAKMVGINIVSRSSESEGSVVSQAKFDSDGMLIDWPYGFFSPSMNQ